MKGLYSFGTSSVKFVFAKANKLMLVLALLAFTHMALAQERTISGKVVDKDFGDGLPGTNVFEKGTSNGVTTDIDGNYKIAISSDDAVLVFSFVGYKTQEIKPGARSVVDVQMTSDLAQLGEVVIVGYGTQEAKDVTGSVNTVTPKDFNKGAIVSPDNLISGKMPGVVVTPSAEPGGAANIRIRGATSIGAGQDPLIVVDGIPLDNAGFAGGMNPFNFINPNDVESVTVLKDASATAIYGARGAAGVIIYTTKSGKAGEPKVSYDGFYSISTFNGDFGFLSPQNFRNAVQLKAPQRAGLMGNENTIWADEVVQQVSGQSHNLSFTGGNEKTTYSMSINHMDNNGVVRGRSNNVTRMNMKISSKFFNDDLLVTFQAKTAYTRDNFAPNVVGTALGYDPTKPIYDDESPWGGYWEWPQALAPTNPISTLDQTIDIGETRRALSGINFEYKVPFIKGLKVEGIYSADLRNGKNQFFQPTTYRNLQRSGQFSNSTNQGYTLTAETFVTYEKSFDSGFKFDVMYGYSLQEVFRETFGYTGWDISTDAFKFNEPSIADELVPISPFPTMNRLESHFARLNTSYLDKYLVTLNFRADGSTKFGPGNRYGFFPSAALGWRIIEEDFMADATSLLSDLKLRGGYGVIGNQSFGDYLYETFYGLSTATARYQFGNDYYQMLRPVAVDPNVRWEQTETINIGLDFGLFRGRLNGFVDVYQKTTSDLLNQVPPAAGTVVGDVVVTNVAEMVNKGVELSLSAIAYDSKDLNWDVSFNAAWNKNEVTRLSFGEDEGIFFRTGGISGDVGQTAQVIRVGVPINSFFLYNQQYDESGAPLSGSNTTRYEDINEDGLINENDLVAQRQPDPIISLGLTNGLRYKNWNLDFTMRANLGQYVYNNTASANGWWNRLIETNILNNIHESVLQTDFTTRQLLSNYYLENASFLRMDNITLSYSYNNLEAVKMRFYSTVQNAFTISGYSGPNPEVVNGIDNNLFPLATTYIFGVNLTF